MVDFKFIEYGTNFGTRDMGMKLREKLLPLINGNEKVVLDFTGVNVVSNSFADECIAKLLLEMPLEELKWRFSEDTRCSKNLDVKALVTS